MLDFPSILLRVMLEWRTHVHFGTEMIGIITAITNKINNSGYDTGSLFILSKFMPVTERG